jgi:predicted ribosome quality control (RQC) complex YloA/Tae2 family protein
VEEEEIPEDTVTPPTPSRVAGWARALEKLLAGRKVRSAFRTEDYCLSVVLDDKRALVLATHPAAPLIAVREENPPWLEELHALRENLGGLVVRSVTAVDNEPSLVFYFAGPLERKMVWEGMKRSSNVLLLDADDKVLWALRNFRGEFRQGSPAETWSPPPPKTFAADETPFDPEKDLLTTNPALLSEYLLDRAKARKKKGILSKIRSLERKREALAAEAAEAEGWLKAEPKAKALLSAGNLKKRGEASARITDYSADHPREELLQIDPKLTILENAEKLFKLAKKGRERLKLHPSRDRGIEAEISALREAAERIDGETELSRLYPSPAEKKKREEKKTVDSKLPKSVVPLELPRGFKGYAGKSAAGNDHVSFRIAKGEDFWFHVSDYKGVHVVVRNPSRLDELPLETEMAAARHAALHSSAPEGCEVEVIVTKAKYLTRVRKTPGAVYVSSFRKRLVDLAGNG